MTAIALRTLPLFEPSIVPAPDQERIRLLLCMKQAADFYALEFAYAEYTGFVRGLYVGFQISQAQLIHFQLEAGRLWDASASRFLKVIA